MNDNAKKWVEALESESYQQCQGALHEGNRFCCLGVACELYQAEVGDLEVKLSEHGPISYDGELGVLPSKVRVWLGLRGCDGEYKHPIDSNGSSSLASRNDAGASFEDIAKIIKSEPERLFLKEDA